MSLFDLPLVKLDQSNDRGIQRIENRLKLSFQGARKRIAGGA